jgi:hypothetical protein
MTNPYFPGTPKVSEPSRLEHCKCGHVRATHWGAGEEARVYLGNDLAYRCRARKCKCKEFRERIKLWNWPWRNMWR